MNKAAQSLTSDQIYARAAKATGIAESQLKAHAERIFATMLQHAMQKAGGVVWTSTRILDSGKQRLDVEVDARLKTRDQWVYEDLLEALKDIVHQAEITQQMIPADLADSINIIGKSAIRLAEDQGGKITDRGTRSLPSLKEGACSK
jgi:hypothetical protein